MAFQYRALTCIRHGEADAEGLNVVKEFEQGALVTGLGSKVMKALWENGALEQVEVEVVSPSGDAGAPVSKPDSEGGDTSGGNTLTGEGS